MRVAKETVVAIEYTLKDDQGNILPDGQVGEVVLRGPHMMSGYWKRPEATRRALDSQGWLRTGDAASLDADGFLFLVDRRDDMGFLRIINVPARGLGKTTIERLKNFAAAHRLSLFDAIEPFVSSGEPGAATGQGFNVVETIMGVAGDIANGIDRAGIQARMKPGAARNGVDCALWDLEAKKSGKRVWDLAGRPAPKPVVTAFTISFDTSGMTAPVPEPAPAVLLSCGLIGLGARRWKWAREASAVRRWRDC